MTEITDMLGVQRSILAELRRTREAVERIERLMAHPLMKASFKPGEVLPGEITFDEAAKSKDRIKPPRWPARFADPGWMWACGNSMHSHRSKEEAEACAKENKG